MTEFIFSLFLHFFSLRPILIYIFLLRQDQSGQVRFKLPESLNL